MKKKGYYTIKETQKILELLGVKKDATVLRNLCQSKKVKSKKIKNLWYIDIAALMPIIGGYCKKCKKFFIKQKANQIHCAKHIISHKKKDIKEK